jgi:hypothetical protein
MKEFEMHALAVFGTVLTVGALTAPIYYFGRGGSAIAGPRLSEMEVIEADLAMKSEEAPKTPQKVTRAPDPKVDEAVGGDPNAKPDACKKDSDCGAGKQCRNELCVRKETKHPDDQPVDLSQFDHPDDDADVGDTKVYKPGAFDGDEQGWAPATRGDKFYIELNKDLRANWEYPELLSDEGFPAGCIHITPDGKIPEVKMEEKSGNVELDDSVERALTALQKIRNQDPVEVPTHLLQEGVTEKWLCFRFKPKAS